MACVVWACVGRACDGFKPPQKTLFFFFNFSCKIDRVAVFKSVGSVHPQNAWHHTNTTSKHPHRSILKWITRRPSIAASTIPTPSSRSLSTFIHILCGYSLKVDQIAQPSRFSTNSSMSSRRRSAKRSMRTVIKSATATGSERQIVNSPCPPPL